MVFLTDFIPEFRKIEKSLENDKLIMIIGDTGTGKTKFVNSYFSKFKNYLIKRIDSDTPMEVIISLLKTKDYFYDKKIVIYDDFSISRDIIKVSEKIVPKIGNKLKFIVIINRLKGFSPMKYKIYYTRYPKKDEVYHYLNGIDFHNVRNKLKPLDDDFRKKILNLKIMSLRRIEMAIEDGFITEYEAGENEKFNILKLGSFMTSLAIAENLTRFKKFDESLCDMDKLKKYDDDIYFNFIKLYYPNLQKMRLRYPKKLYELIRNK